MNFVVLDQHIDTTTIYGRLTFQILSSVAEFGNEIRRERQKEGIKKVKRDGKQLDRKPSITADIVQSVLNCMDDNLPIVKTLKANNISNGTYYRIKRASIIICCSNHQQCFRAGYIFSDIVSWFVV